MTNAIVQFTKMHGIGNDFVVINAMDQSITLTTALIKHLADRHIGIGFDQLLIIDHGKRADFFCRIFNNDASEAEQCGNGLRCIARYLHERGLHQDKTIRLETKAGVFPIVIDSYDRIRIELGVPQIQEKLIYLDLGNHKVNLGTAMPMVNNQIAASILSLGNPHAIIKMTSLNELSVNQLGQLISSHNYFPKGANVGFMQIVNDQHLRLRTYERGSGETHACGSSACAAVIAGITNGWLNHRVKVEFRYGSLTIEWLGDDQPIYMMGPATHVFNGAIAI